MKRIITQERTLSAPRSEAQVIIMEPRARNQYAVAVTLAVSLAILTISFLLNSYRLAQAVDLKSDEATYAIESVSLTRTGITRWNGGPFLVHPPLFYMVEGAYYNTLGIGYGPLFDRLIGKGYTAGEPLIAPSVALTGTSMVDAIMAGRYLTALYGAIISVLIFLLGSRLLDWRLGGLSTLLFMLDPYTVWRNHFNYLEPLTALFGLLMIFVYYAALNKTQQRQRTAYLLLAGIFFGLSLLTKELALIYFPPLLVHSLLFRRLKPGELTAPLLAGLGIYTLFPLWAAAHGQLDNWWNSRTWLFSRISGEIRDTGVDRPGSSLARTLSVNLPDYWPWFILMAIAAVLAVAFVYIHFRYRLHDMVGEFLASLVIGSFGFFVVIRLVGGVINEHFLYLLMPFVAMMVAYGVLEWPRLRAGIMAQRAMQESLKAAQKVGIPAGAKLQFKGEGNEGMARHADTSGVPFVSVAQSGLFRKGPLDTPVRLRRVTLVYRGLLLALALLTAYNMIAWIARYGFSRDDSYVQLDGALANRLPAGEAVVGRDLLDLYLMPKNAVYTFSYLNFVGRSVDPANLIERRIPYAILNDQSLLEGYGGANVEYYDWVRRNGDQISDFKGRIYNSYAYRIDYTRPVEVFGRDSMAVGRPVVASSSEAVSRAGPQFTVRYGPEQAFDAKISTRWSSGETDNEWIYVDLGESKNIGRIELLWEHAYANNYELQLSDDAKNWTTFYSTTSGAGGLEKIDVGALPAKGRYLRLLMTERATEFGYSLWEISIYP